MLGRSCTRRLRAPRPYVCLPCLRSQRKAPPVLSFRALDSFRAAHYHSSNVLRNAPSQDLAREPEAPAPPPLARQVRSRKHKQKKKTEQADTSPVVRKVESKDPAIAPNPVAKEEPQKVEDGAKVDGTGVGPAKPTKGRLRQQRKQQKAAAKKAAKKAAKAAKDDGQGRDIGKVLLEASENGAAEVLAQAAKQTKRPDKGETLEQALKRVKKSRKKRPNRDFTDSVSAQDAQLTPIDVEQPPIPYLSYGLDRVLFNPGVCHLQDPRSQVYNFDPYLQKIMPVADFNFDLLKRYITSSQDDTLSDLARDLDKRYVGSTSSMTAVLAHFHFLLSNWRRLNLSMLSKGFPEKLDTFTRINRLPAAIFLRWKNGTYAIDADKQYDTANVLSMLGRSMEKLLTLPTDEFERYRRGHPNQISDEERGVPESYHYTTQGDMLMRSQLDAQDNRLPGTGMFDLKTRAVVSIRMDVSEWEQNTGYQIKSDTGKFESFEREYYDMIRSTMLKYSLQARMGRMDGIFVAFHNIERIFGFQYVSIEEMDRALHNTIDGTRHLGDQEFRLSVDLLNKALNIATEKFPETSIRFHFETREGSEPFMYIFAEPMPEEEVQKIQDTNKARTEAWERRVLGLEHEEMPEDTASNQDQEEDVTVRLVDHPAIPENPSIDAVIMPELFEIPDEEPAWSSLAPHAQPEALEKEILENTQRSSENISVGSITETPIASESSKAEEEAYSGPLLCLKLFTRSKIGGEYVDRVKFVTEQTDWEVAYQFEEVAAKDAYRRYAESKKRRSVLFVDPTLQEEDHGEEERVLNYYQRKLRDISKQGRKWREEKDEAQKGKKTVVYQPREGWALTTEGNPAAPTVAPADEINGVDGYMSWLFGKKR